MRRPQRLFIEAFLGSRHRLFLLVCLTGVIGGLVGAAYVGAMKLLMRGLFPTHWDTFPHLFVLAGAGLTVGLLTHFLGNPGDVELLVNNIHVLGGSEDIRDLRSLIPVSLLCIASGGAMGPEAPLVQTTGSLGSWLAMRWRLSTEDMRVLTITGMAAGFTVLFGAPLGSAIFALEILHRRGMEYYEALLPAVIGSLAGYAVYLVLTGTDIVSVWDFPGFGPLHAGDLLWALGAGVVGAGIAAAFTFVSQALRWAFRKLPVLPRPLVGGLVLGLLAFWSPYALTFGEYQIDPLVARHAATGVFVVAVVAKLLGTSVTLSSGWRGGFIIPLFFTGVSMGRLGHHLFPSSNEVVLMACLMTAINVGVTKTPLGSTLVVTEMAGLQLFPVTLVAALVSLFLTSEVALIHTQREREGAFSTEPALSLDLGDTGGLANPRPTRRQAMDPVDAVDAGPQ